MIALWQQEAQPALLRSYKAATERKTTKERIYSFFFNNMKKINTEKYKNGETRKDQLRVQTASK